MFHLFYDLKCKCCSVFIVVKNLAHYLYYEKLDVRTETSEVLKLTVQPRGMLSQDIQAIYFDAILI